MRARALFVGTIAALAVAVAGPASAKGFIAEANISGPGLGGGSGSTGSGMRLEEPAAEGMWESGVLDDRKEDAVSALGLARTDLGPRYLVTFRFEFGPGTRDQVVRQELYPYAEGGPVTYTPPGQEQTGEEDLTGMGMSMPIPAGWFRTSAGFFRFLVENGLAQSNPVVAAQKAGGRSQGPVSQPAPVSEVAPWGWILIGLAGLAALAVVAPPVRRRLLLAVTRANH